MKPNLKERNQKMGQGVDFLSDELPYGFYDKNHGLYLNQDSIGFVFSFMPMVGVQGSSVKELEQLFANILPADGNIQFLLVGSTRVNPIIDKWVQARTGSSNPLLGQLARDRGQFFKEKIERKYDFQVLISYSQQVVDMTPHSLKKIALLKDRIKVVLSNAREVGPVELIHVLKEFLNENNSDQVYKFYPLTKISKQLISSDTVIEISDSKIQYEERDRILKSYIVDAFPFEWDLGQMINFLGSRKSRGQDFNCPFLLHYGVHICKTEALNSKLITKGRTIQTYARRFGSYFPDSKIEAAEWQIVNEKLSQNERPVKTIMQVLLCTNKASEDRDSQALESLFTSNGFAVSSDIGFQLPSLIAMLPMTFGAMIPGLKFWHKLKSTVSSEPIDLLPIQAEWKGTPSPCMLLSGRLGQISYFNPFDNKDGNFNMCISGTPGSGKSVLMQELITSQLGLGAKVFVLDLGRSYQKICDILGGEFIEFGAKAKINLNPFAGLDASNKEQIEDGLEMFKQVLRTMAAPSCGTNDLENSYLSKAVNYVWEHYKQQGSVDHIADFLSKEENHKANELGEKLFTYTSKDSWGKYFQGKNNVNFDNDLVVIELQELLNIKELQSVILQMFAIEITNQLLLGDRQRPFLLVIDEAWNLMNNAATGEFIGKLARTVRKCNGALILATQDINDFETSAAAKAALTNSDWVCFLPQFLKAENPNSGRAKSDKFTLDENLAGLINSLEVRKGQYSEFVLFKKQQYTVQRLILDPFSKVLYSTSADEFSTVMKLQQQGMTMADAVKTVADHIYGAK